MEFIAQVEALELTPDSTPRIVVNERTGTIVANSLIRIGPCAVSHGNITINITSSLDVSQPNAFSQTGSTVVTPKTDVKASESKAVLINLPDMPTVEKVASSLNASNDSNLINNEKNATLLHVGDRVVFSIQKHQMDQLRKAASNIAAARQQALQGQRVGVIVSGGNVDMARFCALLAA